MPSRQNMLTSLATYASLFAIAFLAATILPAQSEAVLAGLFTLGSEPWWALIAVATLGNTAGAVVNWMLGRGIEHYQTRRWFPVTPAQLDRARVTYERWGHWCLLFSWVPIVGDVFTVLAGVLRERLSVFVPLVAAGKLGRYLVVAGVVAGVV